MVGCAQAGRQDAEGVGVGDRFLPAPEVGPGGRIHRSKRIGGAACYPGKAGCRAKAGVHDPGAVNNHGVGEVIPLPAGVVVLGGFGVALQGVVHQDFLEALSRIGKLESAAIGSRKPDGAGVIKGEGLHHEGILGAQAASEEQHKEKATKQGSHKVLGLAKGKDGDFFWCSMIPHRQSGCPLPKNQRASLCCNNIPTLILTDLFWILSAYK